MKSTQQPSLFSFNLDRPQQEEKDNTGAKKGFSSAKELMQRFVLKDKGGYISKEFQDFGYRMALELDDMPHKSLYNKLAKRESRGLLEKALSFVSDAPLVKSKAKLFMWKVKQLREERKAKKTGNSNEKKSVKELPNE